MTPRSQILGLANQNNFLQFFSLMIDVFTPIGVSPDCPFKSNQRLTKISFLTLWCAVWLRGEMHTAEFELVGSTPRSLTPRGDAHSGAWLYSKMHTAELDSEVGCTPRSSTPWWDAHHGVRLIQICPFFVFSYLLHLSTPFFWKTHEVKKIS